MTQAAMRRVVGGLLVLAVIGGLLGACSGSDSDAAMDTSGGGGSEAGRDAPAARAGDAAYDRSGDGGDAIAQTDTFTEGDTLPLAENRVIKTAYLRLEVSEGKLGEALRDGRTIAETAGGYLLSTSVGHNDGGRGEFVIRVPAERFEETLSELEALGKVVGEDVTGEDVSQEFVDLESRLRNSTAQEEVLLRLYDRSTSIADTIRVQRELQDVQLEIERLRGRLRFLADRTDLSTISVSIAEDGIVQAADGPFEKAWETARKTFVAVISAAIVGTGFVLPLTLFALIAYAVFRLVRPRFTRPAAPVAGD